MIGHAFYGGRSLHLALSTDSSVDWDRQVPENVGGAEGNRTPDLCSAIAALSHLSYGPEVAAI
jgi:hypothetical protein